MCFLKSRGVGEPLNENEIIRAISLAVFDVIANSSRQQRSKSLLLNNPPTLAFSTTTSPSTWYQNYRTSFEPFTATLPENVHLLNVKTLLDGTVILRLHHLFAVGEDAILSQPATINLNDLFTNLTIVEITEMTMTANQPLDELHRLDWKTNSVSHQPQFKRMKAGIITLNPMDTRTFIVRYQNE